MIDLFIKDIGGIWHELELKDESIATTFQSNNIGDISSRNASYSNKINIPKTPKNVQLFDFLGLNGNISDYPYTTTAIRVIIGGLEVIPNGVAYISETNDDYIFNFYDGLTALSDKLGDKMLADLDFSSVNHDLNYTELATSFLNTSGFIYTPYVQYVNGQTEAFVDYMVPNLYWLWIWNRIFSESGFEYTGDFFSSDDATTMLVGMPTGGVTVNDPQVDNGSMYPADLITGQDTTTLGYYEFVGFNTSISSTGDYRVDIPPVRSSFRLGVSGAYNNTKHEVFVYLNSNIISSVTYNNTLSPTLPFSGYSNSFQTKFFANAGDTFIIKIRIYGSFSSAALEYQADMSVYPTTLWKTPHKVPINFSQIIGDTKQIDFIKDGMIMFGLMTNYKNNVFEFKHLKDVLTTQSTATDWSDKLVDPNIKESYASDYGDLNAQNNKWNYQFYDNRTQADLDYYNGNLVISNSNLPLESDFYNSIYKIGTFGIIDTLIAYSDFPDPAPDPTGLKLFYLNHYPSGTYTWKFRNSEYGAYSYTGAIPRPGKSSQAYPSNNISGNSFIARYYGELAYVLNRFKRCTMKMLLSPLDIYELDFNVLKYIKHTGKYYYLNKIKNFKVKPFKGKTVNSDTTVDVEMIEIPV